MADGDRATATTTYQTDRHRCDDCGLFFDSAKSLEVHLRYHEENPLSKWAARARSNAEETNNNTRLKREDTMITEPGPEYRRRTPPDTPAPYNHPATPQSFRSAPSPYRTPEQSGFSPGQFPPYAAPFSREPWEQQQGHFGPEFGPGSHESQRFHPYAGADRSAQVSSSSPVYPRPLGQPTPSPSPEQCDRCGFVCDSAARLDEHCAVSHPPQQPNAAQYRPQGFDPYSEFRELEQKPKEEREEAADILDLDSQKVVHQGGEENGPFDPVNGRPQQRRDGPESLPAPPTLPWTAEQKLYSHTQMNGDPEIFSPERKMYHDRNQFPHDQKDYVRVRKMFPAVNNDGKVFQIQDQKHYTPHQLGMNDYRPSGAPPGQSPYFDGGSTPQITSTQSALSADAPAPPVAGKGANWKSNEARRPKTYNCTACNKWFTSSGHLKRHYNTTLHKNAVRSSGQPDPATLPISAHHHPARDPNHGNRGSSAADRTARSPEEGRGTEDGRAGRFSGQGFDRTGHPGIPQPVDPAYAHRQPNMNNSLQLGASQLGDHSLPHQMSLGMGGQGAPPGNPSDLQSSDPNAPPGAVSTSMGSPPNGRAGPSVQTNHHSRGLLSITNDNCTQLQVSPVGALPPFNPLPTDPYNTRATDRCVNPREHPHAALFLGQNFQTSLGTNYPNAMSPHVMDTDSNSPPTISRVIIGEKEKEALQRHIPLPSFSQLHSQRFGMVLPDYSSIHNVGGSVPGGAVLQLQTPTAAYSTDGHLPTAYFVLDSFGYGAEEGVYITSTEAEESTIRDEIIIKTEIKSEEEEFYSDEARHEATMYAEDVKLEVGSEDLEVISNKENYETLVSSTPSPIAADSKVTEYENNGSPSVSSTVIVPPLSDSNKLSMPSGQMIHKCLECDKVFNKACYLTQHNKSFHSGVKPFKCARCGKRFPNGSDYEEHFSKHSGDKPFKCAQCPKQFNHKTDLRRHMCLHSGEKPFACCQCGKGFIRKDHMLKHSDTHRKTNQRGSGNGKSVSAAVAAASAAASAVVAGMAQ